MMSVRTRLERKQDGKNESKLEKRVEMQRYFFFDSSDRYIRDLLLQHGWNQTKSIGHECILRWMYLPKFSDYQSIGSGQFINHFRENYYLTSKLGLKKTLQSERDCFTTFQGHNHLRFWPRSYDLSLELDHFISDFKLTAILNLVKKMMIYIEITNESLFERLINKILRTENEATEELLDQRLFHLIEKKQIFSQEKEGAIMVNGKIFLLLLRYLQEIFILDVSDNFQPILPNQIEILANYSRLNPPYQDIDCCASFGAIEIFCAYYKKCLKKYKWFKSDGLNNIWIIKASEASRGRSIFLIDTVEDAKFYNNGMRIIQKYIENVWVYRPQPMKQVQLNSGQLASHKSAKDLDFMVKLIGKKFDVRIWVLVKSFCPFEVYIYEEGYLRISQEDYQLLDIGKVKTHLTNYTVNWKTEVENQEESYVLLSEFNSYLEDRKLKRKGQLFQEIKQIVTHTFQCADLQCKSEKTMSFELFGVDIIFDGQLRPWLLECNMSPACKQRGQLKGILRQMGEGLLSIMKFIEGSHHQWRLLVREQTIKKPSVLSLFNVYQRHKTYNFKKAEKLPDISHTLSFYQMKIPEANKNARGAKKPTQSSQHSGNLQIVGYEIDWKQEQQIQSFHICLEKIQKIQRFIRRVPSLKPKGNPISFRSLRLIQSLASIVKKSKYFTLRRLRRYTKKMRRKEKKLEEQKYNNS